MRAAPGRTGPGRTGPGRTGPGRTGPGRTGPGRTGPTRTGPERTGPGRTGPGRTGPWPLALLFTFSVFCSALDGACVTGMVGGAVLLPCYHRGVLTVGNFSAEWRRGGELVLRAEWEEDEDVVTWSLNGATIPSDAPFTGNFSLELPKVSAKEGHQVYRLSLASQGNASVPLCSVCLRTAAHFSSPLLQRDRGVFRCRSGGGFPEPAVFWLINDTERPPEDLVRTEATPLPDSHLYNVTSLLTVDGSAHHSVSCSVQNQWINETLTARSSGAADDTFRSRASRGMWVFSTGLCVAVGVMVGAGVAYQIHLDRLSKRRKVLFESARGRKKHQFIEETEEETLTSKETCV